MHNTVIAEIVHLFLVRQLESNPVATLRFVMQALGGSLTSTIASRCANSEELHQLEVHVPYYLATSELKPELISTDTAAHWRNSPPNSASGKRAILFAVAGEELQRVGSTLASIPRIDSMTIRQMHSETLRVLNLTEQNQAERDLARARDILDIVGQSALASNLEMYVQFAVSMAELIHSGRVGSPDEAAEYSLDKLRYPRNSGIILASKPKGRGRKPALKTMIESANGRAESIRNYVFGLSSRGDGLATDSMAEVISQENSKGVITNDDTAVLLTFLRSCSGFREDLWTDEQQEFVQLDWTTVGPIIEGAVKQKKNNRLGEITIDYFHAELPNTLLDEHEAILKDISGTGSPSAAAKEFFLAHRQELAESRLLNGYKNLMARWEKFLFSEPVVCDDLLIGLAESLQKLISQTVEWPNRPVLRLELPGSEKKSFWEQEHNSRVGRFLRYRYHGLSEMFDETTQFNFGRMSSYPLEALDGSVDSKSKKAVQFKFELSIGDLEASDQEAIGQVQFVWSISPDALYTSYPDDLVSLSKSPEMLLSSSLVAREPISPKGQVQSISLTDGSTLRDVQGKERGQLVSPNGQFMNDEYSAAKNALSSLQQEGVINDDSARVILDALSDFYALYQAAIEQLASPSGAGLSSLLLVQQAESYGRLLSLLREHAPSERAMSTLNRRVLSFGRSSLSSGGRALIMPPWQPFRMAEMALKARHLAGAVKETIALPRHDMQSMEVYFEELVEVLRAPLLCDVAVDWRDDVPVILSVTQHACDYSVLEPAVRGSNSSAEGEILDADVRDAARQFSNACGGYLDLLPHEKGNFSVLLYNNDARDLPAAIGAELCARVVNDEHLRCDFWMSHTDRRKLANVYGEQNSALADSEVLASLAENDENFMPRIRFGVRDLGSLPSNCAEPAFDLVLLQDTIARNATVDWLESPGTTELPMVDAVLVNWSKKRPVARGDESSVVYLTSPFPMRSYANYLNVCRDAVQANRDRLDWLPARKVTANKDSIRRIIDRAHAIGDWVVTYDAIADRRLLRNLGINILRHLNRHQSSHSLVVSTTRPPRLLSALLKKRILGLGDSISAEEASEYAERFIRSALELSGLIVMRAARHSRYAAELIGVVLCMNRLRGTLGASRESHIGWIWCVGSAVT